MGDRRTGRTSRTIDRALRIDAEGRAVYVLAANERERKRIRAILSSPGLPAHTIKVETPFTIRVDWQTGRMQGAHPNCVLVADHYAIETHLAWAIAELRADETAGGDS